MQAKKNNAVSSSEPELRGAERVDSDIVYFVAVGAVVPASGGSESSTG